MVVIDGLDETGNDQQEILRNVLGTYRSAENEAIQFAILGRPSIHDTHMLQGDCDIVFPAPLRPMLPWSPALEIR